MVSSVFQVLMDEQKVTGGWERPNPPLTVPPDQVLLGLRDLRR